MTTPMDATLAKALSNLAVARIRAGRQQPYCNAAVYRLRPVPAPGLKTIAVDPGWRMYFDPEVVANKWTPAELAGGLLHEVWHLLRAHAPRRGMRDPKGWNIAGDCEINDDLPPHTAPSSTAAKLADTDILPKHFNLPDGESAEFYYDALQKQARPQSGQSNAAGGGQGRGGQCGSGAGGEPSPEEAAAAAAAKAAGELPDPVTPAETALVIRQTAEAIKAASKGRGTVPAGHMRWADAALTPAKIPFSRLIRATLDNAVAFVRGQTSATFSRPARRDVPGFLTPGKQRPLPEWCIIIDTSGSVDDGLLSMAMREVAGAMKVLPRSGVTVISCDSAAGAAKRVFDMRGLRAAITGGGGTDMRVGIEAAEKLKPRPTLTIVLTDGDTPWPSEAPKCGRVIVGLLGGEGASRVPSWATSIKIEE